MLLLSRIPDPEASKPDDWDEDAPKEIVDEEAEKPEGWLDNEPEEIDDPGMAPPQPCLLVCFWFGYLSAATALASNPFVSYV